MDSNELQQDGNIINLSLADERNIIMITHLGNDRILFFERGRAKLNLIDAKYWNGILFNEKCLSFNSLFIKHSSN